MLNIESELLKDGDFIWFLSDCVMNVLSGVVPVNKKELKKFEKTLRQLSNRKVGKTERLDSSKRLLINGTNTEVLAATFLYNLQQTTCKLFFEQFSVITHLDIGSHLTCNIYAKKFLNLSSEERRQFLEYESDKDVASKSQRKKKKASDRDQRNFEEAEKEIKPTSPWENYFLSN